MTTKYKTFTDYYNDDEEFRKKHLEKLMEKIECDCGFITARGNLARHKKSHLHIDKMDKITKLKELKEQVKKLEKELMQ